MGGRQGFDAEGANGERVAVLEARCSRLEAEQERARDRLHELTGAVATIQYLRQSLEAVAHGLEQVATDVQTLSRRAVERPTSGAVSALAGWASVLLALVALIVAVYR